MSTCLENTISDSKDSKNILFKTQNEHFIWILPASLKNAEDGNRSVDQSRLKTKRTL